MYRNISTIGTAVLWILLPKCGLCLMAYAGIFSALGLGGLVRSGLALPLVIMLMVVNLLAVIYMSVVRKEYAYSFLCLSCAVMFTVNKIYIGSLALNVIAGLVLSIAIVRIRVLGLKKRQCIFSKK